MKIRSMFYLLLCIFIIFILDKPANAIAEDTQILLNSEFETAKGDTHIFSVNNYGTIYLSKESSNLRMIGAMGSFTVDLCKLDSDGNYQPYGVLIYGDNGGLKKFYKLRIEPGTYKIINPFIYGTSTLVFQSEDELFEKESNNNLDAANQIVSNILYSANLNSEEDEDFYKITFSNPGSFNIIFKRSDSTSYDTYKISLYSEDIYGNTSLITSIDNLASINNVLTKYRFPSGTYYLQIATKKFGKGFNDDYQIKVNYSAENPNEYETEKNNAPEQANVIDTNAYYTGNIQSANDHDYYAFSVTGSSIVTTQFTQPRGTASGCYKIELYQKDDNDDLILLDSFVTTSNPTNFGEELILSQGDYFIKVTGKGSQKVSMIDYKIMVKETPIILVEDIQLTPSVTSIYSGVKFSFITDIFPSDADDKSLTWSSSDYDIATVDRKGTVTCQSSGECYIFAKANDGSGISVKYRLVVKKSSNNDLKDINYSTGSLSMDFSPDTKNYTLTINRTNQVTLLFTKDSKYSACYVNEKKTNKVTLKLDPGKSKKIEVTVVAENGDEKVYIITIKRKN